MPGKKGGTAKPSDMLKRKDKDYDEVNLFNCRRIKLCCKKKKMKPPK
jgi:hypothetical protein